MPQDTTARSKASKPSPGDLLEARVAQVWFWEGCFVRRAIDLQHHFDPDPLLVTDLDLLAISVDATLGMTRTIGEAKSGKSKNTPKPLDRVIWLRGLMEVTDAVGAELTSELVPSVRVRQLAAGLGVQAQSVDDLARREKTLRIEEVSDSGAFGPSSLALVESVRIAANKEPDLKRAFWFLRSEVWFLDPFASLKRTLTVIRALSEKWTPKANDAHEFAVRWLLCEAVSVATLNLVAISGFAVRLGGTELEKLIESRLAEGSIALPNMRALSRSIDEYIAGLLRQLKAPDTAIVQALGAFEPTPPDYSSSVVELARRLSAGAPHSRHLPRVVDLAIFERMVRQREPSAILVNRLAVPDTDRVVRAGRLIASFLRGQAALPEAFSEAIGQPLGSEMLGEETDSAESTPKAEDSGQLRLADNDSSSSKG
ncbi:MAG: DNA-binding response regulator [Dehalococcoidia bacterium]